MRTSTIAAAGLAITILCGCSQKKPERPDYSEPGPMADAYTAMLDRLGSDTLVNQATFNWNNAAAYRPDGRGVYITSDGLVEDNAITDFPGPGAPLASLQPVAVMTRLAPMAQQLGCKDIFSLDFVASLQGKPLVAMHCELPDGSKHALQEGADGAVLGTLDPTTADGIAAAWRDLRSVIDGDTFYELTINNEPAMVITLPTSCTGSTRAQRCIVNVTRRFQQGQFATLQFMLQTDGLERRPIPLDAFDVAGLNKALTDFRTANPGKRVDFMQVGYSTGGDEPTIVVNALPSIYMTDLQGEMLADYGMRDGKPSRRLRGDTDRP